LRPSLEAQLANVADEIAYNNHDVDDGLRSGLLTVSQLAEVSLFARHMKRVVREYPKLDERRMVHETVRRMISTLVVDLTRQSAKNIATHGPHSLDQVRSAPALIAFSPVIQSQQTELKRFLRLNLYQHYQVARMTNKARRIITELFDALLTEPRLLPPQDQGRAKHEPARAVADYVAGMTDRYAMREHRRLFAVDEI
jgi:dGTPase